MKKWRLWPRVGYKSFKGVGSARLWKSWISVTHYWGGRLIYIGVRHHFLIFDFRRNILAELAQSAPEDRS